MAAASSFTFAVAASAFAVATSAFTASAAASAATTMVTMASAAASVGMYKFTVQTFRKLFFSRLADADYLPGEM